ncbi:hypothetical protein EUTSA_v10018443mg [Eutrema salsugineum]|uniref:Uncharacterized protein n=1 Tax=Eutrema salsugineum TaxID=72664 RepID=V4KK29_EUTSA|nr:caldesmon [Eutrema salsugineum]ESQ27613.1 hypothetical protein EUTSA_v10018443mg [Eutrema salsugineum]
MPPFRFNIPFFSYGSPSRLSSRASSPSPPPTPPPSRPPFRPAGIAKPSKPATSSETKSKTPSSLPRARSNVAAIAASSSAPTRLAKQSNQSGSPVKESLRAEEKKEAMKDKPSRVSEKESGENIHPVTEKPLTARSKQKEAEEEAQKQRKITEVDKLAVVERNSKTAQEQQKQQEIEKLAVEENKKVLGKDMEENLKTAREQHKRKESEKLAAEERNRALQTVRNEDATRSKTTRHIAAASDSSRGPRDLPERRTQNRTDFHNDDNRQRTKDMSTGNHEFPRDGNRERSSSMSRRIKEDIRDGISKLTWGKSNGDEKSVSVFTLTGENRGATMAIHSEKDKKDGEVHIHRGYRSNPEESPNTTSTDTEGGRRPFDGKNEDEEAKLRAYVNGNTQAINNSIVCDSSVQENDPGIHMSLKFEESKKKKKDETISPPENKSEAVSVTAKETEKLKHEPRVRRRCLRGLLAETSESEPENPLKPRRHGCRFTCKDKDKDNT